MLRFLREQLIEERNSVYFKRQNLFFSIFDNSLGFETVAEAACKVSMMEDNLIFLYNAV